jgi:glycosyltransferase involved in cell wall biosynthesis
MSSSNRRIGLLAFGTDTGLGNQTRLLYRLLSPSKVMLVDISSLNGLPVHGEWFRYDVRTYGYPSASDIEKFLQDLDVVIVCETPLNHYLFERAKQLGIATVQQYNYEFLDFYRSPHLARPTVLAAPTSWHLEDVRALGTTTVELPMPVDDTLKPHTIEQARHFFHIAGRPAANDRNGTLTFIKAARIAARSIQGLSFTLYCQTPTKEIRAALQGSPVRLVEHVENPADMYAQGDVMVLPRRYGGLCLPLNEAIAHHIPVLMPDVSPNNQWLPAEWLVPVTPFRQTFHAHVDVEMCSVHEAVLARRMVHLAQQPERVRQMHVQAKDLADKLSWANLQARYEEVIERAIKEAKS